MELLYFEVHVTEMCINEIEAKNNQSNLELALERIQHLENELIEKTKLVDELLISKDELLNEKYKDIVEETAASPGKKKNESLCDKYNNTSNKSQSLYSMNDSSFNDDFSINTDVIQAKIQNFLEYVCI